MGCLLLILTFLLPCALLGGSSKDDSGMYVLSSAPVFYNTTKGTYYEARLHYADNPVSFGSSSPVRSDSATGSTWVDILLLTVWLIRPIKNGPCQVRIQVVPQEPHVPFRVLERYLGGFRTGEWTRRCNEKGTSSSSIVTFSEIGTEFWIRVSLPSSFSSSSRRRAEVNHADDFLPGASSLVFQKLFWNSSLQHFSFENQFVTKTAISSVSSVSSVSSLWGLGERDGTVRLPQQSSSSSSSSSYELFNKNWHVVEPGLNLYGSHPFVLWKMIPNSNNNKDKEKSSTTAAPMSSSSSSASGLFLFNSNAMQVDVKMEKKEKDTDKTLVWQPIGGVVDLFVFRGSRGGRDIISTYSNLIGRPAMPPSWALGFHQCKYGYRTTSKLQEVVKGYVDAKIPLEAICSDVDVYDSLLTFTVDPVRFAGLGNFVEDIQTRYGMHYVLIIDPGMKTDRSYLPYAEGLEKNVFIRDSFHVDGPYFPGKMFPGKVNYPDFQNPNTSSWWTDQFRKFRNNVSFDGVWLDQDELTNFCDGWCDGTSRPNRWDDPPSFLPLGRQLNKMAISMSAEQFFGRHYDTHNLYPVEEGRATETALSESVGREGSSAPFAVSRSSWPGLSASGTGHWLGDNNGTWDDLRQSIQGLLAFNLFGIPLVGADVGGFYLQTGEELMIRWIQLGAFYPFFRDHAHKTVPHQELYSFGPRVASVSRKAISQRLSLVSFLRTAFYRMKRDGFPLVITPLFLVFDDDVRTWSVEDQFFWGDSLLVSPILEPGTSFRTAYVPSSSNWFRFPSGEPFLLPATSEKQQTIKLNSPLDGLVPVLQRGGTVVPLHTEVSPTVESTLTAPLSLLFGLDVNGNSVGSLFFRIRDNEKLKTGTAARESFVVLEAVSERNPDKMNSECDAFTRLRAQVIDAFQVSLTVRPNDVLSTKWPLVDEIRLFGVPLSQDVLHVYHYHRHEKSQTTIPLAFSRNATTLTIPSLLGELLYAGGTTQDELLWTIEVCFEDMPVQEMKMVLLISVLIFVVLLAVFVLYVVVVCMHGRVWGKDAPSEPPVWYESVNSRILDVDD